jgi:acetyltransferase-like isoleucine patch superfamily enzyme
MAEPQVRSSGITNVDFGLDVVVVMPVNLYGCRIGDRAFIGPFVEIQRGAVIGRGTRIQSHAFVCELVTIGVDCVIAHGVMFINDTYAVGHPAGGDRALWKPTQLGDRVYIGSNATILPVTICSDVVIGAGAVVTRDINVPGTYAGNPARVLKRRIQ